MKHMQKPMFTAAELADPRLIAPPSVNSAEGVAAWGLKSGAPVRWTGAPFRDGTGKVINTGDITYVK